MSSSATLGRRHTVHTCRALASAERPRTLDGGFAWHCQSLWRSFHHAAITGRRRCVCGRRDPAGKANEHALDALQAVLELRREALAGSPAAVELASQVRPLPSGPNCCRMRAARCCLGFAGDVCLALDVRSYLIRKVAHKKVIV